MVSSLRIEVAKRNFFIFLWNFTFEGETITLFRNVNNGITNDENSHPSGTDTSSTALHKPKNSHNWFLFGLSLYVPVTFDLILSCILLLKSVTITMHVSKLMTFIWKYIIVQSMEEILKKTWYWIELSSYFWELVDAITFSRSIISCFIVIISHMSSFQRKVKTEENMKNS